MRHNKKLNHLGRQKGHREAMLKNMAASLIEHKRITTTLAKAKALKIYVEPLITKSKDDTTHSRRMVFSYLQNKHAVNTLFREVADKIGDRPGGYTRILKTGFRKGDGAEMCMIELVDFNENMLKAKAEKSSTSAKPKRKRTRRSGKSTSEQVSEQTKETIEAKEIQEQPKTEAPKVEEKASEQSVAEKKEDVKKDAAPKTEAKNESDSKKSNDDNDKKE